MNDFDTWLFKGFGAPINLLRSRCLKNKKTRFPDSAIRIITECIDLAESSYERLISFTEAPLEQEVWDEWMAKGIRMLLHMVFVRWTQGPMLKSEKSMIIFKDEIKRLKELLIGMREVNRRIDNKS